MRSKLVHSKFDPYRKVFREFGFGERTQAVLISQIYPLSNFLNEDGSLIKKFSKTKNKPGKKTIKHVSERRFAKTLGIAPEREWSGDKKKQKKAGSQICRVAMYQWIKTRIEKKDRRPTQAPTIQWLDRNTGQMHQGSFGDYYNWQKEVKEQKIRQCQSRTAAKCARALLYALHAEIYPDLH